MATLQGRTILITGAARGIGAACARRLAGASGHDPADRHGDQGIQDPSSSSEAHLLDNRS